MCTADLGCTGGNNDIAAGTDTDFVGACTSALTVIGLRNVNTGAQWNNVAVIGLRNVNAAAQWNNVAMTCHTLLRKPCFLDTLCRYKQFKSKEGFFDILHSSLTRTLFTGDKSLLSI